MNLSHDIQKTASRRAKCIFQGAILSLVFFRKCLPKYDAVFYSDDCERLEQKIVLGPLNNQSRATIILAGHVALTRYCDTHFSLESSELLKLANEDCVEKPMEKFAFWVRLTSLFFKEETSTGYLALAIAEKLEAAGSLTGLDIYRLADPFTRFWEGRAESPVGPLQIIRDESLE